MFDDSKIQKAPELIVPEGFFHYVYFMAGKSYKAPNTTEEEQTVTAGQREVNMMWERTQSVIARVTVFSSIILDGALCLSVIFNNELTANQLALINLCLQPINLITGIVIGFYFSRTNHTAIGGTGHKPAASSIGTR